MKFNISAFTHIGTKRSINQDRVLAIDKIIEDGFLHLTNQENCYCFVADGIGGGKAGEIASQYVLENVFQQKDKFMQLDEESIKETLNKVNDGLIEYSTTQPEYAGTGTTLTGLIALQDENFQVINAGDSEIWVLRENLFFKITESQVFDEDEKGSPLVSYFGGEQASLELSLSSSLREIRQNDLFVICSDGLLGSLLPKQLKAILLNEQTLQQKSEFILEKVLNIGANDNVSCILVEVLH